MLHRKWFSPILPVAVLLLGACGSGGDSSPTKPVAQTPVLTTINVTLGAATLQVPLTTQASASGLDQNGGSIATGTVAWSSSSPTVASVSAAGSVTALAPGQTQIRAEAGGKSGQATLTVIQAPVAAVAVSPSAAAFTVGLTQQLTATTRDASNNVLSGRIVTWSTSNAGVATVTTGGLVAGVAAGDARITATSEGVTATANITVVATVAQAVCAGGSPIVAVIVDPRLSTTINAGLDRLERDICADGWTTVETRRTFATPAELRSHLLTLYESTTPRRLDGVILIGDFPRAYQFVVLTSTNPSIPDTREELISLQYYSDLDGVFAASPGYVSPGRRTVSFDTHTGNLDSELWVGVLPLYQGSYAATETALVRYFQKNHDYRTGVSPLPRSFLQVSELQTAATAAETATVLGSFMTGTYAWTPFSTAPGAQFYFGGVGVTVDQGYTALSAGTADFFVGDAHGWTGAHGRLTIAWAESQPVATSFFWSNGCSVANIDVSANFLTSVLYSPTSKVVVAKGSTNNSGGMGNNTEGFYGRNVATYMSTGRSFGSAVRSHINVPLIFPWSNSREFQIATAILLGDPTLRLR